MTFLLKMLKVDSVSCTSRFGPKGCRHILILTSMQIQKRPKKPVPRKPIWMHSPNLRSGYLVISNSRRFFTDSRRVLMTSAGFSKTLKLYKYLEETKRPNFEYAFQLSGGDESEIAQLFNNAATNVQLALSRVHHYKDSEDIQQAIRRLGIDVLQLLNIFPSIRAELQAQEEEN